MVRIIIKNPIHIVDWFDVWNHLDKPVVITIAPIAPVRGQGL